MKLKEQVKEYCLHPTKEKLADTLIQLCQSECWIPMTIVPNTGIHKVPDELIKGNNTYIPLFTDRDQIPRKYYNDFFWQKGHITKLVDTYSRFVVDPFTSNMIIDESLVSIIQQSRKEE